MPAQHRVSRRGLRARSTIVVIAPYGGIGRSRRATMSARRVDRRFATSAPDVTFSGRAASSRWHLTDNINFESGPYYSIDSNGMAGGSDAPLIEVFQWRNRSRVRERKRLSENWKQTEQVLAHLVYFGDAGTICTCARKDRVETRLISLESWTTRYIDYCSCSLSTSALIEQGYFPSTPRKPRSAFSTRMLQVLHEQSVRGSISKSAWADGLRAVFECDLKTSLPGFARQVNSDPTVNPVGPGTDSVGLA